ncbi:phage protein F-like protein [Peptoanaerobacter stomatis]|uniref:Phage protein F-like protein n=1 Tax=Peptoanaerobacter stomatis TaxID=796937 RepID=J5UJA3_9FIRM|nr:phage minor head protein [Peptoanaerobacter stomatis]EJU22974.1 phage protein F-like protein [Peptoanaerobacter stomatis]
MLDEFQELDNLVQKILKMSEKDIQKNYKKTLEELRTTIRKQYDKYEKGGKLDIKEMSKYDRLKKFDDEIKIKLYQLYKNNNALINATLTNICETTRDIVVDTAQNKTKKSLIAIKKTLDIEKTVNEEMAGLHWANRTAHHRNEVIYQVQKTLKEGLSYGSTYKQMSDRLTEKLNGDVLKPIRIIRTEGARVHASTQMQSLDKIAEKGVKMTKKWLSAKDERVRDMHRQMHGISVAYEDDFALPDGTKTKMPHLSGVAKHDINCRCIVTIDFAKNIDKNTNFKGNLENWKVVDSKNSKTVTELHEYDIDGVKYKVDGRHVKLDYDSNEKNIADIIAQKYGKDVQMVPRILEPKKCRTPDYLINGEKYDLKSPTGSGKNTIYDIVKSSKNQADNCIIALNKTNLSMEDVEEQINKIYKSKHTEFIKEIVLFKDNQIIRAYYKK